MSIPRASAAVIRFLGSFVNIFLIRSFAWPDMEGHGELCKSRLPSKIASNMPFSVSVTKFNHVHVRATEENDKRK